MLGYSLEEMNKIERMKAKEQEPDEKGDEAEQSIGGGCTTVVFPSQGKG